MILVLITIHVVTCYLLVYTDLVYSHVTQSEDGLVKIYWNLNGLEQDDPYLIKRLRNEILIPPNPNLSLNLSQKLGLINLEGQFKQVPKVERTLGISMATPTPGNAVS